MNDELFRMAKQRAAASGTTFTAIVEDGVRAVLMRSTPSNQPPATHLPTFRGQGLQPGVDLDSNAALLEIMDGHR